MGKRLNHLDSYIEESENRKNKDVILITGSSGNLGSELVKFFPEALAPPHRSNNPNVESLDITNRENVFSYIEKYRPDVVIHCAALVNVRACEEDIKLAWSTNFLGTENVIDALLEYKNDAYFVYMSTACVFDGRRGGFTEEDIPCPDNVYSLTKFLGEIVTRKIKNHLIIRTNYIPRKRWKYESAFTDRFGTFLFADEVAAAIKEIVSKRKTGVVHICGEEKMSIFDLVKITTPDIKPLTLKEFWSSEMGKINATQDILRLPRDMSLNSIKIKPYKIRKSQK